MLPVAAQVLRASDRTAPPSRAPSCCWSSPGRTRPAPCRRQRRQQRRRVVRCAPRPSLRRRRPARVERRPDTTTAASRQLTRTRAGARARRRHRAAPGRRRAGVDRAALDRQRRVRTARRPPRRCTAARRAAGARRPRRASRACPPPAAGPAMPLPSATVVADLRRAGRPSRSSGSPPCLRRSARCTSVAPEACAVRIDQDSHRSSPRRHPGRRRERRPTLAPLAASSRWKTPEALDGRTTRADASLRRREARPEAARDRIEPGGHRRRQRRLGPRAKHGDDRVWPRWRSARLFVRGLSPLQPTTAASATAADGARADHGVASRHDRGELARAVAALAVAVGAGEHADVLRPGHGPQGHVLERVVAERELYCWLPRVTRASIGRAARPGRSEASRSGRAPARPGR